MNSACSPYLPVVVRIGLLEGVINDDNMDCLLARAALEYITQSGRRPNVLHIHEWQTAGAALLYWEIFANKLKARRFICVTCPRAAT